MSKPKPTKPEKGIEVRHARKCDAPIGARCVCVPTFRGHVYDSRAGKLIRSPAFETIAQARNWRQDALVGLRHGTMRAPSAQTVSEAAAALKEGMRSGAILDRSGKPYKPATVRSYEQALNAYVVPALGTRRLSAVERRDVQDLVDEMRAKGLAPATILNKLDPLRVIYRRALRRDEVAVDPTTGLELPKARGRRVRVERAERAGELIAALPPGERALWAVAFYAGLRVGEMRALRWSDVDFEGGVLRVERGVDDVAGEQDPKSEAGKRSVPLAGALRRELAAHKLATGRGADDLVFGRTAALPFIRSTVRSRARRAWTTAGLEPMTPHEARHCAASYFIDAGMNPKQISVYIGHSTVSQTWDRYGHLMPGGEREAAAKLDAYLDGGKRGKAAGK